MTKTPKPNSIINIPGIHGEYEIQYAEGFIKIFFDDKELYNSKNDVEQLIQKIEKN